MLVGLQTHVTVSSIASEISPSKRPRTACPPSHWVANIARIALQNSFLVCSTPQCFIHKHWHVKECPEMPTLSFLLFCSSSSLSLSLSLSPSLSLSLSVSFSLPPHSLLCIMHTHVNSLALVDDNTLLIGSVDQIQMLHIQTIPLGETPRYMCAYLSM